MNKNFQQKINLFSHHFIFLLIFKISSLTIQNSVFRKKKEKTIKIKLVRIYQIQAYTIKMEHYVLTDATDGRSPAGLQFIAVNEQIDSELRKEQQNDRGERVECGDQNHEFIF